MFFEKIQNLEELRREYRRLCRIHHPDMGGDTATIVQSGNTPRLCSPA